MQTEPHNKQARRPQWPRATDAFDRELKAVDDLKEAQAQLTLTPSEEAAKGVAEADVALKAARAAYLTACHADECEHITETFDAEASTEARET